MFGLFERPVAPEVRGIGARHGAACAAIHAACFAFAWPADDLEALLIASSTVADGAFGAREEELHGFMLSRLAADEAEVLTIAVAPRRRGRGVAGRLLQANVARLAVLGAKSLFLEVEADNHAGLALYRRAGFVTVGERKSYYRKADGSAALAYIMRRTVD